jgi:dehydrogenase/reductase SDR family protein 1
MADLKGKVALVTGASRGLGAGIAEGLAEAGATIYLTARTSSKTLPPAADSLEATAARVQALGGVGMTHRLDQRDDAAVAQLFARIQAEQGRLDVLVNNAAAFAAADLRASPFWEAPISVWDDQQLLGLHGAYLAAANAAAMMVAAQSGLIVNISCAGALEYRHDVAYGVIKAASERMVADMARQLASHHVCALALRPARIRHSPAAAEVLPQRAPSDLQGSQSARFVGRCIAALAMDPDILEKSGGSYPVAQLAAEYRFSELSDHQ